MALSPIILRLQNNGVTLSKIFKFKTLFLACLTTQEVLDDNVHLRQERMKFEIQQDYIVILFLKV